MIKLYRFTDSTKEYWETWNNGNGEFTVHWGKLGDQGNSEIIKSSLLKNADRTVNQMIVSKRENGFFEIGRDDQFTLLIEYPVEGMGNEHDLDKRYALQARMDETLGWTGLGHCDGGSIGSGTMEVCCFVVDFETAKRVIQTDLAGTQFADYTRIYDENLE
jgi:hypothetical protein